MLHSLITTESITCKDLYQQLLGPMMLTLVLCSLNTKEVRIFRNNLQKALRQQKDVL